MGMPTVSRRRAILYLVVVAGLLLVAGRLVLGEKRAAPASPTTGETTAAFAAAPPAPPPLLVVHVVGAVARPGTYRLDEGSRVEDALAKAGGATRKAAIELVNLAAPVVDGTQVVVPARATSPAGGPGPEAASGAAGAPAAASTAPLSLNSATVEQLDGLPGVGPVTAAKIVQYRTEHGPFRSVDDLDAIPGIGPARLEQLRELVTP